MHCEMGCEVHKILKIFMTTSSSNHVIVGCHLCNFRKLTSYGKFWISQIDMFRKENPVVMLIASVSDGASHSNNAQIMPKHLYQC